MRKNMGNLDRLIRLIVAATIIILFFTSVITGVFGFILLALAAVFAITAVVGFCPLYLLRKWNSHIEK